tara:strand:+ start:818 stop:961 length:144 start_codon:yes stop_codon:yes gene_type:complete
MDNLPLLLWNEVAAYDQKQIEVLREQRKQQLVLQHQKINISDKDINR